MADKSKQPIIEPKKFDLGLPEAMFVLGIGLLFSGLWLLISLGMALSVSGAILVAISVLSAWWSAQPVVMARDDA